MSIGNNYWPPNPLPPTPAAPAIPDNPPGVDSFNGRVGEVMPVSGDYTAAQVTDALNLADTGTQTIDGSLTVTGDITVSTIKSSGSAISAVTVPASAVALPAVTVDTLIYIVGGTVTAITLNGNALPTSIPLIYQRPGDSIVITYSTAPTNIWAQTL